MIIQSYEQLATKSVKKKNFAFILMLNQFLVIFLEELGRASEHHYYNIKLEHWWFDSLDFK